MNLITRQAPILDRSGRRFFRRPSEIPHGCNDEDCDRSAIARPIVLPRSIARVSIPTLRAKPDMHILRSGNESGLGQHAWTSKLGQPPKRISNDWAKA